jgi:hypothetical protein
MAAKNVWNIFTSGHSRVDDSHSECGLQQTACFRVLAQGRDKRPTPIRRPPDGALHLKSSRPDALALVASFRGSLCFASLSAKKYGTPYFQSETELQNVPEAAPEASPSFSVFEKLARYGSSALSGVEHLTLLVGKQSVALALICHFGSLKAMARASFQELRQFLPRRQA